MHGEITITTARSQNDGETKVPKSRMVTFLGFPFILLGILRMKKKAKKGGLVSTLNSLQVVIASAKKISFKGVTWYFVCTYIVRVWQLVT